MRYSTPKTTIVMTQARRMSWIWRAAGVLKLKLGSAIAKFKTRATRNPATNAPTLGRFARRGVGGGVTSAGPDALSRSQVVERQRDEDPEPRETERGVVERGRVDQVVDAGHLYRPRKIRGLSQSILGRKEIADPSDGHSEGHRGCEGIARAGRVAD